MSSLQDKLHQIFDDEVINPIREGEGVDPKSYFGIDSDEIIAQIQAAFQEAGYIKAHTLPKGIYNATGHSLTQIAAGDTMTGQEFYNRVDKAKLRASIKNMASTFNQFTGGDRALELLYPLIDKELRLAAGVSEAPPKLSDGTLYPWLKKKVDEEKSRGVSDE